MLQIIGWMLCVYLFVKGCELATMKRQEGATETVVAYVGGIIAILGSFVFFVLVNAQASSVPQTWPASQF